VLPHKAYHFVPSKWLIVFFDQQQSLQSCRAIFPRKSTIFDLLRRPLSSDSTWCSSLPSSSSQLLLIPCKIIYLFGSRSFCCIRNTVYAVVIAAHLLEMGSGFYDVPFFDRVVPKSSSWPLNWLSCCCCNIGVQHLDLSDHFKCTFSSDQKGSKGQQGVIFIGSPFTMILI